MKLHHILKQPKWLLAAGITCGLLIFAALRFVTYQSNAVHYHANFALYINGVRDQFKNPSFYEEVAACTTDDSNDPRVRVHMHDEVNDVVHVHAKAVTWGQFFENLGYSISEQHLQTLSHVYLANANQKMHFILNGQSTSGIANQVINSTDKLLISYGVVTAAELQQEYRSISSSAVQYNQQKDPASCKGPEATGWRARWHHIWH